MALSIRIVLLGLLCTVSVYAGQFIVRTEDGDVIKHADSAAYEAARDESNGKYASAILIYDQMSQQGKLSDRLLRRMVHCHEMLEKQDSQMAASFPSGSSETQAPADDLFPEKEPLAAAPVSHDARPKSTAQ